MKLSLNQKDLMVEFSVLVLTLCVISFLLLFTFLGFIFPFSTYHYSSGVVEYKNEVPVSAEASGIILNLLVENFSEVKEGQVLAELSNKANLKQSELLGYQISKVRNEIQKLERLQALGSVSSNRLRDKKVALQELLFRRKQLKSKTITAPFSGRIYFKTAPRELLGSFVFPGQTMAYIHASDQKIFKMIASVSSFDRFAIGDSLKLYSGDSEAKREQITGFIQQKSLDRENQQLLLYGTITKGYEVYSEQDPGSQMKVGVLLNKESLFESFFDFDLYAYLKQRGFFFESIELSSFLTWLEE